MKWTTIPWTAEAVLFCVSARGWGLDSSVPFIHGDLSRILLGDGTGVVVGIVDSGVDDTHPALAGMDSLGIPRLVAESNFVTSEPTNTGDDVFGHGTWVASAALSSDPFYTGMAPDARFINARVLNSSNGFPNDTPVKNGIGFAIDQGANILNLSLNFFAPNSSGNSQMDLMVDWAAFSQGISCAICVGNIHDGTGSRLVRAPGSAYNGVTVGRTTADFSRVHLDSATAFTADGRMKPDVVAPGTSLTLANDDWERGAEWDTGLGGCSFATPHVAGLMAQQIEAGISNHLSTDPLVIKSTILNSSNKDVLDKQRNPWQPATSSLLNGVFTVTKPLDDQAGAGQIDGLTLSEQYLAGEMAPGAVDPIGWDLNSIVDDEFIDYSINPNLVLGSTLTATLAWNRHVGRTDNGDGIINAADTFRQLTSLSNLDLQILRDGELVAQSISSTDNMEHLSFPIADLGQYTVRVMGMNVTADGEPFALAWHSVAVPEPATLWLVVLSALAVQRPRLHSS